MTVLPGKDGRATRRKDSVTGKDRKQQEGRSLLLEKIENNRMEGHCKMERLQEGMTVSLGKDRKATGSKDIVTGVR